MSIDILKTNLIIFCDKPYIFENMMILVILVIRLF